MSTKNNKEELIKLIQENPDLPIVFSINNEYIAYDYGSSVMYDFWCDVGEIWDLGDEMVFDDKDYVLEYYQDMLYDDDKYKDLSDEEYEKAVAEYVENNVKHYTAIIISVSA